MHTIKHRIRPVASTAALVSALLFGAGASWAQQTNPAPTTKPEDDTVVVLSPFEVSSNDTKGYAAATTLAGNRLNTELRDIGNAVTVITSQFLKDIGATDNQTLLQYTTNTEVGNVYGNFAGTGDGAALDESPKFVNPNQNTRVRGLTAADNTRDYFLTDIPWDGYAVDGVDLQRGPNSILFGQGSPAGIINTRTKQAQFKDANEVQFRYGSNGAKRASLDINKVILKDELALRLASVYDDNEYKQDPAYSLSKRAYAAARWEPKFLKKGSARTIFKANYEVGDITSNNPRTLPPIDLITPWFYTGTYVGKNVAGQDFTYNNLNRLTLIPSQNEDDNTGLPNHGQNRPSHNGPAYLSGTPNEYYNPWIGNFGQQFGNPTFFFNDNAAAAAGQAVNWEPKTNHGIGPDGSIDRGLALPFQRPAGVTPYSTFAKNAHLPYSDFGIYKDRSLTDSSVFDFYNNLLDGPNKKEWQSFRTYNLNLAQTFFHDQAGFELSYNREFYKSGQLSILSGEKQAIGIDLNSYYSDGTGIGPSGEFGSNGTPNPNVGRPFISDSAQFGNNSYVSNRESGRATVFVTHDFTQDGSKNWVMRLLGQHTITGLYNQDAQRVDNRAWQRYGTDKAFEAFVNNLDATDATRIKFTDNSLTPNTVIYLGPSLSSKSTASGAYIPNPSEMQVIKTGTVRTFDSTWNRSTTVGDPNYVDPAAFWYNDYYPHTNPDGSASTTGNSTQSENPANYVGFRNVPVNVINSEDSQANRDYLTTAAKLTKSRVFSRAFTWQGHLWDNSIVGTFGVRKDVAKSWTYSEDTNSGKNAAGVALTDPYGHINLDPSVYKLADTADNRLEVTSHAWTLVAHLNSLPFVGKFVDKLPVQVSLFYNHSTDFQPAAQRVDAYGVPLGPPSGVTRDEGILLETKDGKFSLKINKYETSSTNASSQALGGSWFIGSSQAWAGNWVNRFEFNWTGDTNRDAVAVNDPTNSEYNYGQAPGETLAQAQTREANVIAAYRAWQKSIDPRFYTAWKINLNDPTQPITASTPSGFAVTEDSVSKGYEIEFNALPTKNWRLTINGSKTDATRSNIGGTALSAFIAGYEKALKTTAAGDLRIWWGGAGNETALQEWNSNIGSEYAQRKLQEGTNVPELREWRFNGISNYDFDHGVLKGVNVGGGVRYESSIVIGYKPLPGATINDISFDIANPYRGPMETNFDFWVGYSRRIWHDIDWNIQLNVRNAFVGNELIPLTTQPDGTPASYRIRPPQYWSISNTFKF
jgi:outer membrane receptor protein involved in Fe transport